MSATWLSCTYLVGGLNFRLVGRRRVGMSASSLCGFRVSVCKRSLVLPVYRNISSVDSRKLLTQKRSKTVDFFRPQGRIVGSAPGYFQSSVYGCGRDF